MRIQISLNKKEQQAATKTLANIKSVFGVFKKFSDFIAGESADKENVGKIATINKMVRKPGAVTSDVKDNEEGSALTVNFSEELTLDSLKITGRFFEYFANISMMFAPIVSLSMQKWGEFRDEFKEVNNKYERSQTVSYVDGTKIPEMLIDDIDFNDPDSGTETKFIKHHMLDTEFAIGSAFDCDFGVANGIGKVFVHVDGNDHLVFDVDVSCYGEDFKTNQFASQPNTYRIINVYMAGEIVKPEDYKKAMYLVRALRTSCYIKEALV